MTTDDIIRSYLLLHPDTPIDMTEYKFPLRGVKHLVDAAIKAEREACAKVAEERWLDKASCTAEEMYEMQKKSIAAAIRARGYTKPQSETVSPAELRRRTNAPWNDKASY